MTAVIIAAITTITTTTGMTGTDTTSIAITPGDMTDTGIIAGAVIPGIFITATANVITGRIFTAVITTAATDVMA